jgi:hypothetical protein
MAATFFENHHGKLITTFPRTCLSLMSMFHLSFGAPLCGDDVLSMLRSKFPTTRILLTDEEAG